MTVKDRLAALREKMQEAKIDVYLVPTDDFHNSEYVGDYFKCRQYITGFTGSAGTAVITRDMAGLWTDGRYFIQAANQLEGSTVELFKMGQPGVPTVHEFLEEKLAQGMRLGFDGRTVSASEAEKIKKILSKKNAEIVVDQDLIGEVWENRPLLSAEKVWELEEKWVGESRKSKISRIRKELIAKGADAFILTTLDDIAWLLNLRGDDIHCCPVFLSYLIMTEAKILLFANKEIFSDEILEKLESDSVEVLPYEAIYDHVRKLEKGEKVLLNCDKVNSRIVSAIPEGVKILDEENLTLVPKAVKTPTEVENERIAHIKDGVALTKFMHWLKKNVGKIPMTELSVTEKLFEFRKQGENFLGNSFDPIVSYGAHAAMNHYSATPETDIAIEPRNFLLADTGGHYLEGTTDTTRTFVMGPVTEEQKKMFTAVLRGMLNLGNAKFLYGCAGVNLDYLACGPLWEMGEGFNHGTGHGVGYLLNVHEGPNSFSWRKRPGKASTVLEEGMITSDEPGYYVEDEYGIRHENMIVCKKWKKTAFGQFMCFEHLTMVPFDLEAVVPEQMNEKERELLNEYHARVYENISPYLNEEEKTWLKEATRRI